MVDSSWFRDQLQKRMTTGRHILGAATGDLGSGKTYWCLKIAETMDRDFTIDRVVFDTDTFTKKVLELQPRSWLVYDEPGVTLSNRNFMSDSNRITSLFLQSSRYLKVNVLFALPTLDLMDVAARTILLFQANMVGRGMAIVYRIKRNQFGPGFRTYKLGIVKTARPSPPLEEAYEEKRRLWHLERFGGPHGSVFSLKERLKQNPSDYLDDKGKVSLKKIIGKHEVSPSTAYQLKVVLEAYLENMKSKLQG